MTYYCKSSRDCLEGRKIMAKMHSGLFWLKKALLLLLYLVHQGLTEFCKS